METLLGRSATGKILHTYTLCVDEGRARWDGQTECLEFQLHPAEAVTQMVTPQPPEGRGIDKQCSQTSTKQHVKSAVVIEADAAVYHQTTFMTAALFRARAALGGKKGGKKRGEMGKHK